MNKLIGTIKSIRSHEQISICIIQVNQTSCEVMVIDRPESADYLREGSTVALLFKETQVVLSKSGLDDCSLNNSFQSEIVEIEAGALFCRVKAKLLEFELSALITNKAYLALALEVGTSVIFHVRSNEIMLTSP